MFVDQAQIAIKAGKGGDGKVALEERNMFLMEARVAETAAKVEI